MLLNGNNKRFEIFELFLRVRERGFYSIGLTYATTTDKLLGVVATVLLTSIMRYS